MGEQKKEEETLGEMLITTTTEEKRKPNKEIIENEKIEQEIIGDVIDVQKDEGEIEEMGESTEKEEAIAEKEKDVQEENIISEGGEEEFIDRKLAGKTEQETQEIKKE